MGKDDEYMAEINRLEGERDHYKRRSQMLSDLLDVDLEIRASACQWYDAWKGRSVTAMKDANLRLRKAVESWNRT
jgi:hypothetical protein